MRRTFALAALLAGATAVAACGEFVSDVPDDANLNRNGDGGTRADVSPGSDTATVPSQVFSCADPKYTNAIFCDDFSNGMTPGWVAVPSVMPAVIAHKTPDLLLRGAFEAPRAFLRHDFKPGQRAFDIQFQLRVNAASAGHVQVFTIFPGSSRSVGFVLDGTELSLFSYDDGSGYKAGQTLLPNAQGEHVLRLVADGTARWQFEVAVDNGPLSLVPQVLADPTVTPDTVAIAAGLVGGDANGTVDYSIDNVLVR